ncbi:hypothetical protein ACEPAG_4293 [Sanghuangporus baumii]
MSLLRASAALPRVRAGMLARQVRGVHFDNAVRHNMPFGYTSKPKFAVFFWGLSGTLFAAPFIVAKYQMIKSGHA